MKQMLELQHMVAAHYPVIAVETYEEVRFVHYLEAMFGVERKIYKWSATEGLTRDSEDPKSNEKVKEPNTEDFIAILNFIKAAAQREPDEQRIYILADYHPYLESPTARRLIREISFILPHTSSTVIMISPQFPIPSDLEKSVSMFEFPMPTEQEMRQLVKASAEKNARKLKPRPTEADVTELARACMGLTIYEADTVIAKSVAKYGQFDVREVSQEKKQIIKKSGVLEVVDPDITLEQLGGLENLKLYLQQVKAAAEDPKAQEYGVQAAKGILLVSAPGCGKSALFKAIANYFKQTLVRFDYGSLMASHVGESESNITKAFARIDSINRCVVGIDEIEKAFPNQGAGDGDSGVNKRMFGKTLSWMQDRKSEGFIVAAANLVTNLPPELLRPGRFDGIWYIDLPNAQQRAQILAIHLKKRKRDPEDYDLKHVSGPSITGDFSGAELEQVVINALRAGFTKKTEIDTEFLLAGAKEIVPLAVSRKEDLEALRTWAKARAKMASISEAVGPVNRSGARAVS
jgi:ATP-dependent Zn protease